MKISQNFVAFSEYMNFNKCACFCTKSKLLSNNRGVVPGGAGGAMALPDFGRSVNPISTKGTDYAHLITTGTAGFSDLPTALP